MFRNKSVDVHQFSMIPKADIPRSSFRIQKAHKTTFNAGYLVPVYLDEILPGDTFNLRMTAFARMATPIFPLMDNLYLDSFFFFVPNRLVWDNWKKFMGEQVDPGDSIAFSIPQTAMPLGGYSVGSLEDYMGLPTIGQMGGAAQRYHSALFQRAYNLIWNEWFRDENLQQSQTVNRGAGPDNAADYTLLRRGKRQDYFTSCLPWPQKGGAATIPFGSTLAPVIGIGTLDNSDGGTYATGTVNLREAGGRLVSEVASKNLGYNSGDLTQSIFIGEDGNHPGYPGIYADLSVATNVTINALRQSFQIQKLLERDARGGTRYTEIVRSHFGVISPDARLQRPEYLGGGSTPVTISPIAQTSGTGLSGGTTPLGNLAAMGTILSHGHGFTQSFTEHGMILGLVSVRADLTYQQGMRKMWSRLTRYDFYFPAFAHLGEQAVLKQEIYCDGSATDLDVFGYQERWAEYRYNPSQISGLFKSTSAGTLDGWHLAQRFTAVPTLNSTFIQETPPLPRVLAVTTPASSQFYFDSFFDVLAARPMPMYSVPGLIDHF